MRHRMRTWTTALLTCGALALTSACGPSDEENNTSNENATANNTPDDNPDGNNPDGDDREQWNMCREQVTEYMQFEETISSAGRVGAFEDIADRLWRNDSTPTGEDFVQANAIYLEPEGLDSRVSRREDEHYEPVMEGGEVLRCRDEGVPAMDPDRCVGPAQIKPIIIDAFEAGANGEAPEVHGARVEAALLWFFYVSSYKEGITCTEKKKDCDSCYAYYTGDRPQEEGIGLAGYFRDIVPDAHDLTWDGILAVRCWREVDDAETATNLELRDDAMAELDKGLLYGVSRLVTDRLDELDTSTGVDREADWAWLQIMGPVLEREANVRDADAAAVLEDAFDQDSPDDVDVAALTSTIEELFPKPPE